MKRNLLILTMICCATILQAQQQTNWWGYCAPPPADPDDIGLLGMETADTYDCCIQLTQNVEVLRGATVHGIAFMLPATEHFTDVRVWLSKELPSKAEMADVVWQNVPAEALHPMSDGYIRVSLNAPYAIDDHVYAGYSFTVTQADNDAENYPICCYGGQVAKENAFFFKAQQSLNTWQDVRASNQPYGDLMMQVLISNPGVPQHKATLLGVEDVVLVNQQEGFVPVYVQNDGLMGIRQLGYTWVYDGQEGPAQTFTLSDAFNELNQSTTILLPLTPTGDDARHDVALRLTHVNGQPNEALDQQADAHVIAVAQKSRRRILVEEFTGTWCGWCTRGMVAMDYIHEHYPNEAVTIAVHGGDLMAIAQAETSYDAVLNTVSGFPSARLNRLTLCDPYHGTATNYNLYDNIYIDNDIHRLQAFNTEAALKIAPQWNSDSTAFVANTEITFQYNRPDAPYALAYVLIEDDLHGNTSSWNQENYYSQYARYADYFQGTPLYELVRGGSRMSGVHYNHVAMAAWHIADGIDGSIEAPLVAGQTQTFAFTSDLPDISASLLQDKTRLSLAVLLINRESGEVVNCAVSPFGTDSDAAAVESPQYAHVQNAATQYFTPDGRQHQSLRRGLNIIRTPEGRIIKRYIR